MSTSEQLRTYPSPYLNLTLSNYQMTVVELGEGWMRICSDADIDPKDLSFEMRVPCPFQSCESRNRKPIFSFIYFF